MNNILKLLKLYFCLLKGSEKVPYSPLKIWIETTARCNLSCRLCANKDIAPEEKQDMDMGLFKKIIDEIRQYGPRVNLFHRGEPLLHPQIAEMVKYCRENHLKTSIHTNAVALSKELSEGLIRASLDNISFSFDGYSKNTYEKNRVGAVYENTLENIKDFLKVKEEMGSRKPLSALQIMEFDEDKTRSEMLKQKAAFLSQFKNTGLNKITIRKPHNWGGLIDLKNSSKKKLAGYASCTFPYYSLVIFFDGKITICPQDFFGIFNLGDASKDNLNEIFNCQYLQAIRRKFKNKDIEDLNPCVNCDRIRRKTIAKIPMEYFSAFIKDTLKK